jgi:hypothetical protein
MRMSGDDIDDNTLQPARSHPQAARPTALTILSSIFRVSNKAMSQLKRGGALLCHRCRKMLDVFQRQAARARARTCSTGTCG